MPCNTEIQVLLVDDPPSTGTALPLTKLEASEARLVVQRG